VKKGVQMPEDMIKLKGKGKKAVNRLNSIKDSINSFEIHLNSANTIFTNIIEGAGGFEKIEGLGFKKETISNKNKSPILNISRIEFTYNNLDFYIDFTIVPINTDDSAELRGGIVYGANRTLCFKDCILKEDNTNSSYDCFCERISRCDALEDKPLLQFTVNRDGLIKSIGDLDDEWWIKEKEDLLDLHLRALDFIWRKALEWTNEKLLP
jgi:hypothetical protein